MLGRGLLATLQVAYVVVLVGTTRGLLHARLLRVGIPVPAEVFLCGEAPIAAGGPAGEQLGVVDGVFSAGRESLRR